MEEINYRVGDEVILGWNNGELHDGWIEEMRHFLGERVTIGRIIDTRRFRILEDRGVYVYWFNHIDDTLVTKEEKEVKLKEALEALDKNNIVYKSEDIKALAEEIYGEDRVWLEELGNYKYNLYIHFPELIITNSREEKHLIKDLYVKMFISIYYRDLTNSRATTKGKISISGGRSTYELIEWECDYGHSHFSGKGLGYSDFCMGASVFGVLLNNLGLSLEKDDWVMVLLGLEKYLKWESLEGGPYRRIGELSWHFEHSDDGILEDATRLISKVPAHCWEWIDGLKVVRAHPDFKAFLNNNALVRGSQSDLKKNIEAAYKDACEKVISHSSRSWKGKRIPTTIIKPEVDDTIDMSLPLQPFYLEAYVRILETIADECVRNYEYNKLKQNDECKKRIFGETRTVQQAEAVHHEGAL